MIDLFITIKYRSGNSTPRPASISEYLFGVSNNSNCTYCGQPDSISKYLFGVSNNSNCTYCGQPDSISHTFIGCHHSKAFFQNVLQHFNEENATSFTLSDRELLFGKSFNTIDQLQPSPPLKTLKYCMLLAKYYLYNQKLNQIEAELNEFKTRLNFQYRIEKLV